MLVRSAVG